MFLAHGPVGYTVAVVLKRFFRSLTLTRKRLGWILGAGFVAGIFPDTDLFYFYLFDVEGSHREFWTHSPVATLVVMAVTALVLFVFAKKREPFHVLLWLVISLGHFSHIVADSLGNGVRWLYPSPLLYGLALSFPVIDQYFFLINFGLEFAFIAFFFWHLGNYVVASRPWKVVFLTLAVLAFIGGELLVGFIHSHSFRTSGDTYYGDVDTDLMVNVYDEDVDGDGLLNLVDPDANGNGISNEDEAVQTLDAMTGVWHDPLNGSFLNMFTRLGFFLHSDVVHYAYDEAGIFLLSEIGRDAERHPELNYTGNLADARDVRLAPNLFTLYEGRSLLVDAAAESPVAGDLAFIDNGRMVGVISEEAEGPRILMVVPTEEVMPYTREKIESSIGPITHWGRLSLGYAAP